MDIKKILITYINKENDEIIEKNLIYMPIKETIVIEKSKQFFNDPEPCMIHRSAVMKRLYMEVYDFLVKIMDDENAEISWNRLPQYLRDYMDVKGEIIKISLKTIV